MCALDLGRHAGLPLPCPWFSAAADAFPVLAYFQYLEMNVIQPLYIEIAGHQKPLIMPAVDLEELLWPGCFFIESAAHGEGDYFVIRAVDDELWVCDSRYLINGGIVEF